MNSDFQWFQDRVFFGVKAGLENMETMCSRMANPQKNLKVIHVVGSNGKGSTAAILANLLQDQGKVALFTSPHLVSVRERFRINGRPISSDDLKTLILRFAKHVENTLKINSKLVLELQEQLMKAYYQEGGSNFNLKNFNKKYKLFL